MLKKMIIYKCRVSGGTHFELSERVHICNEVQEFTYVLPHAFHGCCCALLGRKPLHPLGRIKVWSALVGAVLLG